MVRVAQADRPRARVPFLIANAEDGILHLAALWERWDSPAGPLDGFTVLTTVPRDEVAVIHHRQPAVLESEADIDDWLDPSTAEGRLTALAAQPGTRSLRIRQVSTAVNNPHNDSPQVTEPAALPL